MSILFNQAYAETPSPATGARPASAPEGDLIGVVLPFVFIFVVFYFLILRPQQKKFKIHQAMVAAIKRGDKVITAGGVLGKVVKIDDDGIAQIEIADGVNIKVLSATISSVIDEKQAADGAKK